VSDRYDAALQEAERLESKAAEIRSAVSVLKASLE